MSIIHNKPQIKRLAISAMLSGCLATKAAAHASEQGFVLLLPTDIYITAGVVSVALTVFLLAVLPERVLSAVFRPIGLARWRRYHGLQTATSCLSGLMLLILIWIGVSGPRDPLTNLLPLTIWAIWWVAFVALQGVLGDLWRWVNPWTGPVAVTRRIVGVQPFLRLPARMGYVGAIATYLGFVAILLADPAPSDPARLATYVGGYWLFTYLVLLVFGRRWLYRGEGFTMLMRNYASLGLFGRAGKKMAVGLIGWQAMTRRPPQIGAAVFMLIMLGSGSFDGLNETFWWLDLLGINPLEFPGRSAVIAQNAVGLMIANLALILAYGLAVWLGLLLIRAKVAPMHAFCLFAPSILPIALGYHIAHYFSSFLVDGQYALAAFNDPLARGWDIFGLGVFYVTTGFFNTPDSVRAIWLTQAGAVVVGHILAVMMAHGIAVRHFGSNRRAALSQAPLALFMILYTLFGLWLLASPRGI